MEWKAVGALAAMFLTAPAIRRHRRHRRTYNNFGVSADDLAAARPHVEAVFKEAGIDVSWVDCWYRDKEVSETATLCRQPLKANEVILRLQAANPLPGKRLRLDGVCAGEHPGRGAVSGNGLSRTSSVRWPAMRISTSAGCSVVRSPTSSAISCSTPIATPTTA